MARVIVTLLLFCQPFCLRAGEVGFAEPGLLGATTNQSRVVIVQNPGATRALSAQAETIMAMVERGVVALTGRPTPGDAWRSLVSQEDIVGIKVHSIPGSLSGTRPAVAAAVIKGLRDAGHPPQGIILWDRRLSDLRNAGFDQVASTFGVRLAGAADSGFDPEGPYENSVLGQLVYGDFEFARASANAVTNDVVGRRSHFSRLLTKEITRHIFIAPLLNHNQAGVSGILYSVASASTDNFFRFEANPMLMAKAVPEIFGEPKIADRVALNIVDALIGQYEGSQRSLLHYSASPNELWFSTDPVALDVLALEELNRIRIKARAPAVTNRSELYNNARWMELGTDDVRRIEILRSE